MNLLNREKDKPKLVPPVPPTSVGSLSQEAKFGLLGLLALSLPYDDHAAPRGSWNRRCMECVCEALGLKKSSVRAVEPLVRDTIGWSRPPPKGRNGRLPAKSSSRSSSKDDLKAAAAESATAASAADDNMKKGSLVGVTAAAGAAELPLSTNSSCLTNSASNTSLQAGPELGAVGACEGGEVAASSWEDGLFDLDDAWEAPEVAAGRAERRAVFEGLLPPLGWSHHEDHSHNNGNGSDAQSSSNNSQQQQQAVSSFVNGLAARHTLLRVALAALVAGVGYDARARTAMQNLAKAAKVPWAALAWPQQRQQLPGSSSEWLACVRASEVAVAVVLLHSAAQLDSTRARQTQWRVAKVGAAAVGGGALLFVTGGLAAPALAAALAAAGVGSAATITLASSAMIVGTVFGAGGAARAGLAMSRRTAGVQEFAILRVDDRGLLLANGAAAGSGNGGSGAKTSSNAPGILSNLPSANKSNSPSSPPLLEIAEQSKDDNANDLKIDDEGKGQAASGQGTSTSVNDGDDAARVAALLAENDDDDANSSSPSSAPPKSPSPSSSTSSTPSPSSSTKKGWASALKYPFDALNKSSSGTSETSASAPTPVNATSSTTGATATSDPSTAAAATATGAGASTERAAAAGGGAAPGLSLTLCVSGWLGDKLDFERPWGVEPMGLSLRERLQRFYFVHNPAHVKKVDNLLKDYRGHEEILLNRIQEKYGVDPRLPLRSAFVPSSSKSTTNSSKSGAKAGGGGGGGASAAASTANSPPDEGVSKEIAAESQEAAAVLAWLEAQAAFKAERKKRALKENNKKGGGGGIDNDNGDDDDDMYDDDFNNSDPKEGSRSSTSGGSGGSSSGGGSLRAVPSFISVPPLASNGAPSLKARLEAWEADQDAERAAELEVNARRAQHAATAEVQAKEGAAAAAATTATTTAPTLPTPPPPPPPPAASSDASVGMPSAVDNNDNDDPVAVAAAAEEAAAMQKAMERRRLKAAAEQGTTAAAAAASASPASGIGNGTTAATEGVAVGSGTNAESTSSQNSSNEQQKRSARDDAEDAIRLVQGAMGSPWPQEEEQQDEAIVGQAVSGDDDEGGHMNPLLLKTGDDDDDGDGGKNEGNNDSAKADAKQALAQSLTSDSRPSSSGNDSSGGEESNLAVNALVARAAAMGISPANDGSVSAAPSTGGAADGTAPSDPSEVSVKSSDSNPPSSSEKASSDAAKSSGNSSGSSSSGGGGGLTGTALSPEISGLWFWGDRFGSGVEQYVLRWESDMLVKLGHSLADMAATAAAGAAYTTASMTVSAVSVTAAAVVMPYYLMRSFEFVDPIWTLACERADAAGVLLAETLLERKHGTRPVTLLGFSMGARLIFACLNELGRRHFEWAETRRRKVISAENEARRVVSESFHEARAKAAKVARAAAADENGSVSSGGSSGSGSGSGSSSSSSGGGKLSGFFSSFSLPGNNNHNTSSSSSVRSTGSGGSRGSGSRDRSPSSPLTPLELQEVNEAARVAANAAAASLEKEESPVAGLIGDVVLMGTPVSVSPSAWTQARDATCGRLVNAYSTHDWTLYALYRYQRFSSTVAGVRPVSGVAGVENIDVSDFVKAHGDYPHSTGAVLDVVQLDDDCLSSSPMGTATQEP